MTLQGLYTDNAKIQSVTHTNVEGRILDTWTTIQTISCRFTQPSPSRVIVSDGASAPKVDAVVFSTLSLLDAVEGLSLPIRFVVSEGVWKGTYEMQKPARPYMGTFRVSHVEFDVVRVET